MSKAPNLLLTLVGISSVFYCNSFLCIAALILCLGYLTMEILITYCDFPAIT